MGRELIHLDHVSRHFPPDVKALWELSLQLRAGEFVAITGTSGSGKSTLLNVLGLLDRPDSGRYWLLGHEIASLEERDVTRLRSRVLGFVFQAFHLIPHLTVVENVELGLAFAGISRQERTYRAVEALEAVALTHRRSAYPSTLSGGESQRVAIARAVVRQPRLMLCDEPTGNLDSENTSAVLDLLESTHTGDRVLLVVTHDPEVARRAPRVLNMRDGCLYEAPPWR